MFRSKTRMRLQNGVKREMECRIVCPLKRSGSTQPGMAIRMICIRGATNGRTSEQCSTIRHHLRWAHIPTAQIGGASKILSATCGNGRRPRFQPIRGTIRKFPRVPRPGSQFGAAGILQKPMIRLTPCHPVCALSSPRRTEPPCLVLPWLVLVPESLPRLDAFNDSLKVATDRVYDL